MPHLAAKMELTPTVGGSVEQYYSEEERLRRYRALYAQTNGTEAEHLWRSTCLTVPTDDHQSTEGYIVMYMEPDGDVTFAFIGTDVNVEYVPFAMAVFSLQPLHPRLMEWMNEYDAQLLATAGLPAVTASPEFIEAVLDRVVTRLPTRDGVPLPVAYVGLSSALGSRRRHLDFFCFREVPMASLWHTFRSGVLGGVIGL